MAETLVELVAKISADATELKKGLADAEGKTEQSSQKMSDSLKKVGLGMVAAGAAITASMGLMGKAAIDESINIKRLSTTMENAGTSYDKVRDSLEAVIATTMRKTGVADDEQRDILNRLILVTNDYNKALKLLPTVLDLAAAGEMDATTAATNLGNAFLELEGGADSVGVRFGRTTVQFKSMEDIQNRVRGSAENLVNPFNVLKASMGEIAETVGAFLIPAITNLVNKVADIAIGIKDWAKEHPELAKALTLLTTGLGLFLGVVGSGILIIPKLVAAFNILKIAAIGANLALGPVVWAIAGISAALVIALPFIFSATRATEDLTIAEREFAEQTARTNLQRQLDAKSWAFLSDGGKVYEVQLKNIADSSNMTTKALYAQLKAANMVQISMGGEEGAIYLKSLESIEKGLNDATQASENLNKEMQGTKQSIASASWTVDGYTYRMQLFTQAEIDAAKASGKKVEELKNQSTVTEDNTNKTKDYITTINDASASVDTLTEKIKNYASIYAAAQQAVATGTPAEKERAILSLEDAKRTAAIELSTLKGESFISQATWTEAAYQVTGNPAYLEALGSYQQGGIVPGPIGAPQLAMVHGGESITPAGESGGITINFTQPLFLEREDQMNQLVDKIRKGIQRQDRLRFGGAYNG